MHLQLTQLLKYLVQTATNPPVPEFIKPPPQLEDTRVTAMLAITP